MYVCMYVCIYIYLFIYLFIYLYHQQYGREEAGFLFTGLRWDLRHESFEGTGSSALTIGALIIKIGFRVYYTIAVIRNPQNTLLILIIQALTLGFRAWHVAKACN